MQTIIRPTRDKKGYRLRCRFKIDPCPSRERLDREKVRVAETFVADMHKQGWEHATGHGFEIKGPFPMVVPIGIKARRTPTAREMLPYVRSGARFLDPGENTAQVVPTLVCSEWWEYEITGVFYRDQIMVEYADRHEEDL